MLKSQQEKVENLTFSQRLKNFLESTDLTQEEVATRFFDIDRSYLNQLANDKKPWSKKNIRILEELERDQALIKNYKDSARSKEAIRNQSDLEWLIENGYSEEVGDMAKILRRAIDRDRSKPRPSELPRGQFNSALDELAQEALEKAVEAGEVEIESSRRPSVGAPSGKKASTSRGASKPANPSPLPPSEAPDEHES